MHAEGQFCMYRAPVRKSLGMYSMEAKNFDHHEGQYGNDLGFGNKEATLILQMRTSFIRARKS